MLLVELHVVQNGTTVASSISDSKEDDSHIAANAVINATVLNFEEMLLLRCYFPKNFLEVVVESPRDQGMCVILELCR